MNPRRKDRTIAIVGCLLGDHSNFGCDRNLIPGFEEKCCQERNPADQYRKGSMSSSFLGRQISKTFSPSFSFLPSLPCQKVKSYKAEFMRRGLALLVNKIEVRMNAESDLLINWNTTQIFSTSSSLLSKAFQYVQIDFPTLGSLHTVPIWDYRNCQEARIVCFLRRHRSDMA